MVKYPEVQTKAQAELDHVLGQGRTPTFGDEKSLPYLMAVVKETFRWHPVAPFTTPRLTTEDDVYQGYHLPKGTIIVANSW